MSRLKKHFWLIIFCFIFIKSYPQKNKLIDSLQNFINQSTRDTIQINAHNELSKLYRNVSNHKLAIQNAEQARVLCEQLLKNTSNKELQQFLKKDMAYAINLLGNVYTEQGDYPQAIDYFTKALIIRQEIKNKLGEASCLNNIGLIYMKQGFYLKALNYYFKALPIAESINHKQLMAAIYNNIGIIYKSEGATKRDFKKGLFYYSKALKIRQEMHDKQGIAASLDNIAIVYAEDGKLIQSLEKHLESLSIRRELNDKSGMANGYNNIALIYDNQKNYLTALYYHEKALDIRREINDKLGIATSLNNMGGIYCKQKKNAKSKEYCFKALALGKELGVLEVIQIANKSLYAVFNQEKNSALALQYYIGYITFRDSMLNKENNTKSLQAEMNFEFEKKKSAERLEQEKRDAVAREKEHRQILLIWSISGILFLMVIFATIILRSNRQKQSANKKLDARNKEILDSIHYAKRIQTALLPSDRFFERNLNKLQNHNKKDENDPKVQ